MSRKAKKNTRTSKRVKVIEKENYEQAFRDRKMKTNNVNQLWEWESLKNVEIKKL